MKIEIPEHLIDRVRSYVARQELKTKLQVHVEHFQEVKVTREKKRDVDWYHADTAIERDLLVELMDKIGREGWSLAAIAPTGEEGPNGEPMLYVVLRNKCGGRMY